jgi:hypothetical protein
MWFFGVIVRGPADLAGQIAKRHRDGLVAVPCESTHRPGIVLARHGELDEAVDHGLQAFQFERKIETSLLSRAADLDHDLLECYPRERVIEPFPERYCGERRALGGPGNEGRRAVDTGTCQAPRPQRSEGQRVSAELTVPLYR